MQMMADSLAFSQSKELKELEGANFLLVWRNLLGCIGKVHLIENPSIHCEAMNCFVKVWSTLDKIRALQPYTHSEMPNLYDFAGVIFKAASMPPTYTKGVSIAFGCAARMLCRRHDQPLDRPIYTLFYAMISQVPNSTNM